MTLSTPAPERRRTSRLHIALLATVVLIAAGALLIAAFSNRPITPSSSPVAQSPTTVQAGSTPRGSTGLDAPPAPSPTGPPGDAPLVVTTSSPTPLTDAEQALLILEAEEVPARDLYSLVPRLRLKNQVQLPRTAAGSETEKEAGQHDVFYLSDILEKHYYTVTATLIKVTDNAYWYAQDGQPVNRPAIERAAQEFEEQIRPTNNALFGTEWSPGIDNDPRITVLFAPISGAGGYYSSADEHTREINPFSNEREMIYINPGSDWDNLESTLAHEYQHMIHWHHRPNHDVWLNEGAAVLASAANGYDLLGVETAFMQNPGIQLNAWQANPGIARANYGGSYLFFEFLRSQYGGDSIVRSVVASPGTGTDAVDRALEQNGRSERFDDVFKQWALANLLDERPGAEAKDLDYPDRQVSVLPQLALSSFPTGTSGKVSQYGAQYITIEPPAGASSLKVNFAGQSETQIISTVPHSGSGLLWSNRGDLANTHATRRVDLSNVDKATLNFHIWFDVEEDLDYGYVEVSSDGGVTWDILPGAHTSATNPNGTSFGYGYTGVSAERPGADANGWLAESISLDSYAGREVLVRFEYVTDDGYNAQGIALDDIAIPEISYHDDMETDSGWAGDGFVRVANKLPQRYFLAAVKLRPDGFDVQPVEVTADGKAAFTVSGLGNGEPYTGAVLVLSGLTPHTLQQASYDLSVRPGE